jgi:hypothetical protein
LMVFEYKGKDFQNGIKLYSNLLRNKKRWLG